MKFKVGDIVRGKENSSSRYGVTNENMYMGKIVKAADDYIDIEILKHKDKEKIGIKYTDLIPKYFKLVEYTYEDLKKSPIGTKITFENGSILTKIKRNFYTNGLWNVDDEVLKDNYGGYYLGKIIKIEEPEYKTVYKLKPEILDEAEKRYLRGVIRPFKDNVETIRKLFSRTKGKYYIQIRYKDEPSTNLPYFESKEIYKNMETDKIYTLEELGL